MSLLVLMAPMISTLVSPWTSSMISYSMMAVSPLSKKFIYFVEASRSYIAPLSSKTCQNFFTKCPLRKRSSTSCRFSGNSFSTLVCFHLRSVFISGSLILLLPIFGCNYRRKRARRIQSVPRRRHVVVSYSKWLDTPSFLHSS